MPPPKLPNNFQGLPISVKKQTSGSDVNFLLNITFACPKNEDCAAPFSGLDFEIEILSSENARNEASSIPSSENATNETSSIPSSENVTNETSSSQNATNETSSSQNVTNETSSSQNATNETSSSLNATNETSSSQNVTNKTSSIIQYTVTRIQDHSDQISGNVAVRFQGQLATFDAQSTAVEVRKKLLEAFSDVPDLKVVRLGSGPLGYCWFVTFTGKPGDLPEMEADRSMLRGKGVRVTVQTIEDGKSLSLLSIS